MARGCLLAEWRCTREVFVANVKGTARKRTSCCIKRRVSELERSLVGRWGACRSNVVSGARCDVMLASVSRLASAAAASSSLRTSRRVAVASSGRRGAHARRSMSEAHLGRLHSLVLGRSLGTVDVDEEREDDAVEREQQQRLAHLHFRLHVALFILVFGCLLLSACL